MILRRLSEHVKSQNWFAVGVEFVVLVFGVFIGLQVTGWSEYRADRVQEHQVVERLIVEYQQNLSRLAAVKLKSERTLIATEQLLSMIEPEPPADIGDQQLAPILLECLTNPKFVPTLGATNSLISSGDLRLILDPEIQTNLNQWSADVQVMIEWQNIERNHGEELIMGLTYDYLAWPDIDKYLGGAARQSALESDFQGLFSSKRFEGLLNNRRYNTSVSIGRIEAIEVATVLLIERLENRLAEL